MRALALSLDAKISRALDLAIEHGDVATVKDRLRELKADREQIARELARKRVALPTTEELMPRLRKKLREIGDTLRSDVASGRLALGALLGDRRIRIYRDGHLEGEVGLVAEPLPAPKRSRTLQEPGDSVVAGGRYARVPQVPFVLPVVGRAAA